MNNHKIFIISGPGGVGKGTIIRGVLENKDLNLVRGLNATTRKPRPSDKKDKHLIFVTKEEILQMQKEGEILEGNFLGGNYYGTLKTKLLDQLKNYNVIIEVDIHGAYNLRKKFKKNTILIFLMADQKSLKRRLKERGEDTEKHIKYRLKVAKEETKKARDYDYVVENPEGHPEVAIKEVVEIIRNELKKDVN